MKLHQVSSLVVIAMLALAGCGQPPDATFSSNREKLAPLLPDARKMVEKALEENFGTPNNLVAWEKFKIDYGAADPTADDDHKHHRNPGWRLVDGRNLYMQHCVHCHGTAGDGNGPTAKHLNPRPRDYRQGVFKFKSTLGGFKPARGDLIHILEQGIPGTYMPSFVLLGPEKLGLLVDYVRWLSIRGNFEIRLAEELAGLGATESDVTQEVQNDESKKLQRSDAIKAAISAASGEVAQLIEREANDLAENWEAGDLPENAIVPKVKRHAPTRESIEKGRLLFLSQYPDPKDPDPKKKTECAECHGRAGRGDGPNTEKFWEIPKSNPKRSYETAGLHDIWGHEQKPRDLTRGVYRGGRRPIDIFRRIHQGIPGTQMAGFGAALTEEEIWDVVNFVLSVPFEGKHSAYPTEVEEQKQAEKKDVAAAQE
ncbi:MAG: cytochrome c [Planctomycetia bacterium]|nr:cytochrome c [Planctomycetia bacterium]